jgi:hypothetical protein
MYHFHLYLGGCDQLRHFDWPNFLKLKILKVDPDQLDLSVIEQLEARNVDLISRTNSIISQNES